MHYVRVQLSTNPDGWITHTFKASEVSELFKLLRRLNAKNVKYEHHFED